MRRAAKVDANHAEVRDFLLAHGYCARSSAALGRDFPDLVVARDRFTALVEVKGDKGKLTPGQRQFRDWWPGVVITAHSGEHAYAQLEAWRGLVAR